MKCSQESCQQEATCSYVWPGSIKRSYACDPHMVMAQNVSRAMGFFLGDVRPVYVRQEEKIAEVEP